MEYSSPLHFIFHGNSSQNPDVIQGAKNMMPLSPSSESSCSPLLPMKLLKERWISTMCAVISVAYFLYSLYDSNT